MSRKALVAGFGVVLLVVAMQCGAPTTGEPSLSISAKPRSIANDGSASTLTINATDEFGKPGTGMVRVASAKGSLKAGADVTLKDGAGTVDFSCAIASDPDCAGSVAISAKWTAGKKEVEASVNVTVTLPMDGGVVGGRDGGADGGSLDGGPRLFASRAGLVAATGDNVNVYALVGPLNAPTPNATVNFTTSGGSFSPVSGTATASATTAADGGPAVVTLFVADAPRGAITVSGSNSTGTGSTKITVSAVANVTHVPSSLTKAALGTSTSGRDTSTQVFFKVVDSSLVGVPGIAVSYKLDNQPKEANVTPFSITDDAGVAVTTLQAGIGVGTATIRATVTATMDAGMVVDVVHPGTPIVLGAPTFMGFTFVCDKRNLPALHAVGSLPPTRSDVATTCRAKLADALNNSVAFKTSVQFSAEVGTIDGPIEATPGPLGTIATTNYSALTSTLPLDVPPFTSLGEPDMGGGRNPRDMTVTLIAIVAGSEEFWDGSGTSNGAQNGKWDPGEWFIDLAEPYIDANDNGKYDPGERAVWDTARLNCTTGQVEPANGKWDGPNGCYDANTQLWRAFHVQFSGPMTNFEYSASAPPWLIPAAATRNFFVRMSDDWGTPTSNDMATLSVMQTGMNVGMVSLNANLTADVPGMTYHYDDVVATETSPGSGEFTSDGGACLPTNPAPGSALTRCIHSVTIDTFTSGSGGIITVTGRMPGTSADGGVRSITTGNNTLSATHKHSSPAQRFFSIYYE